jgi:hypothetical protein
MAIQTNEMPPHALFVDSGSNADQDCVHTAVLCIYALAYTKNKSETNLQAISMFTSDPGTKF